MYNIMYWSTRTTDYFAWWEIPVNYKDRGLWSRTQTPNELAIIHNVIIIALYVITWYGWA